MNITQAAKRLLVNSNQSSAFVKAANKAVEDAMKAINRKVEKKVN